MFAYIPARGGSKRVPRKNIRKLGGKPVWDAWVADNKDKVPNAQELIDLVVKTAQGG